MRRILHVMASGARGGGARHWMGLLPRLRDCGVDVHALTGDDGPLAEQLQACGVACASLPLLGARWDGRWLKWLESAMDRLQPDLVHYHGTRAGFWGGVLRVGRAAQRTVYTAHGLASRVARPRWQRRIFGFAETVACRADAVISVSRADLERLIASHNLAPHRAHHIPNAIALPAAGASLGRSKARARLGLPSGVPLVGCVARLAPQKAVGDLLDAMRWVPEAHLLIIGDGPQRAALARHDVVLQGRAHMLGARDDVMQCLPACDVFALSSRWEGEPMALLEAMGCGLPCVATRTSGACELLRHEETGLLVDVARPDLMGEALARLLQDTRMARRMGAQARATTKDRTYAHVCAQVLGVYAQMLGDTGLTHAAQASMQAHLRMSHARVG